MSHFYGVLKGDRAEVTRRGNRNSGIIGTVASWSGAVQSTLYVTSEGVNCARVTLIPWHGAGVYRVLYDGPVDSPDYPLGDCRPNDSEVPA